MSLAVGQPPWRWCGWLLGAVSLWAVHGGSAAQGTKQVGTLPASAAVALARPQSELVQPALLRMPVTSNTHLVFQPRPWPQPDALAAASPVAPAPQASLGLEFKATRSTDGARSWLRVQLSGDSVLQFRPRGGGLTVTYRSQF